MILSQATDAWTLEDDGTGAHKPVKKDPTGKVATNYLVRERPK